MDGRRLPVAPESPELINDERIRCNLGEGSVPGALLGALGPALAHLVLQVSHGIRWPSSGRPAERLLDAPDLAATRAVYDQVR